MKNVFRFLVLSLFACFMISCGDDGPGSGVDCSSSLSVNQQIADEVDAIGVALQNYIMDASTANCNALQQSYEDYFSALTNLQDCADDAGVGAEWAASIADAQNNIDDLNC